MEANPNKFGVILDSTDEIIILKDAIECLMDPERNEEARNAERKRKQSESGFKIVSASSLFPPYESIPPRDQQYATIAEGAHKLLGMDHYDEIFEALQHYETHQIEQMQSLRYLSENETRLVKFLLGAYIDVTLNGLGKRQAADMITGIDEKLAESQEITAANQ
jgi:hypothetical protein